MRINGGWMLSGAGQNAGPGGVTCDVLRRRGTGYKSAALNEVYLLQIAIPNEKSFIEVRQLPTMEATNILDLCLQHGARNMTTSQKRYVTDIFAKCSLPLFVKLAFDVVFQWKSYSSEDECVLQTTVRGAIASVFQKLEYRHGQLLVGHALSYITRSKNGVTDSEMEDLLSLDDEVLSDVYQVDKITKQ